MQPQCSFWKESCEEQSRISRAFEQYISRFPASRCGTQDPYRKDVMGDSRVSQVFYQTPDEEHVELDGKRNMRLLFSRPHERIKDRNFARDIRILFWY